MFESLASKLSRIDSSFLITNVDTFFRFDRSRSRKNLHHSFKIPQNLAYTQSAALTRGKVKGKIKDTNQISVDNSTGPYKIMHKNNLKIILLYSYN